jgi:hypothetical protein
MKIQLCQLKPGKLIFVSLLSLGLIASASVSSAQIVVTTLADNGTGSLRQAIMDANGDGTATTITFDPTVFPPTSPCQAPFLDQSNVGVVTAGTAINSSEFAAQVITAGRKGILDSVDFAIRKFDGFTFGDITLQIRGVTSGAPNSTILGSKTFANSSIAPAPAEFTTFDLRSLNLFLREGDVYSVVVSVLTRVALLSPLHLQTTYTLGEIYSVLQMARTGFRSVETQGSKRSLLKLPLLRVRLLLPQRSPTSPGQETASTVVAHVSYSTVEIWAR